MPLSSIAELYGYYFIYFGVCNIFWLHNLWLLFRKYPSTNSYKFWYWFNI